MKKIIYISIIFLMSIFIVNADEPCIDGENGCMYGWNNLNDIGIN